MDNLDKQILFKLDQNCRTSSLELGQQVGASRQTVDYRIRRLIDQGIIIGFHSSFNATRVGFRLYKVYLKLRNLPENKKQLLEFLNNVGNVYWIGESSGKWDIIFGVFYKNENELFKVTDQLSSVFRGLIVDHSGHPVVSILQYPKMYFTGSLSLPKEFAGSVVDNELEPVDFTIIALLVNDARTTVQDLSDMLALSPIVIQRRIRKLEAKGILFQYRISVNLNKLNLQLYKTVITIDTYGNLEHERFLAFISKRPEIQFFLRNIWTLELELVVPNYAAYENLIDEIRKHFPKLIGSLDTLLLNSDEWTPAFSNLLVSKGVKRQAYAIEKSSYSDFESGIKGAA